MNRRDQLIEEHLNCVHWVIHNFIRVNESVCGLEYDNLYQEGCIALWRAAESFDEQRGGTVPLLRHFRRPSPLAGLL